MFAVDLEGSSEPPVEQIIAARGSSIHPCSYIAVCRKYPLPLFAMLRLRHIIAMRFVHRLRYRVQWRKQWSVISSTSVRQVFQQGGHEAVDMALRQHLILCCRCPKYLLQPPDDLPSPEYDDEW